MVKAPSSHGLDRKFKSWRKGKSENPKAKNRTSLKHQLRGQTRLLTKVTDEDHRKVLQTQIDTLKAEIGAKEQVEQERVNAQKSHGTRFLERQRLVRLERNVRKNPNLSDETKEAEYLKIALDMAYVAHFPHDVVKYMPIFHKGTRVVDSGRHLNRRAMTRKRVLANAATGAEPRVSWISSDMYNRLPQQEWTLELETATFAGEGTESGAAGGNSEGGASSDNRFGGNNMESSAALLEAAEEIETKLDQEETLQSKKDAEKKAADSSSGSDSIDSDSSSPDPPLKKTVAKNEAATTGNKRKSKDVDSSSGSDSTDSDSSSPDPPLKKDVSKKRATTTDKKKEVNSDSDDSSDSGSSYSKGEDNVKSKGKGKADSDSSDSDSSDSSDSSDEEADVKVKEVEPPKVDEIMEEVDDFLVPAVEGQEQDFFANAKSNIPTRQELKGDKSKGWATQNQRPGEFKKKRIRR
jgi:hypothetical protein